MDAGPGPWPRGASGTWAGPGLLRVPVGRARSPREDPGSCACRRRALFCIRYASLKSFGHLVSVKGEAECRGAWRRLLRCPVGLGGRGPFVSLRNRATAPPGAGTLALHTSLPRLRCPCVGSGSCWPPRVSSPPPPPRVASQAWSRPSRKPQAASRSPAWGGEPQGQGQRHF